MSAHVDSMTMSRMPDLVSQYTCTTSRFSSTRCAAVEDWVGRGGGQTDLLGRKLGDCFFSHSGGGGCAAGGSDVGYDCVYG